MINLAIFMLLQLHVLVLAAMLVIQELVHMEL